MPSVGKTRPVGAAGKLAERLAAPGSKARAHEGAACERNRADPVELFHSLACPRSAAGRLVAPVLNGEALRSPASLPDHRSRSGPPPLSNEGDPEVVDCTSDGVSPLRPRATAYPSAAGDLVGPSPPDLEMFHSPSSDDPAWCGCLHALPVIRPFRPCRTRRKSMNCHELGDRVALRSSLRRFTLPH